jgi:hypothetical protein
LPAKIKRWVILKKAHKNIAKHTLNMDNAKQNKMPTWLTELPFNTTTAIEDATVITITLTNTFAVRKQNKDVLVV